MGTDAPPTGIARSRKSLPRSSVLRWFGIVLAMLGWWTSLDLLRISGGARASNPLLNAFCNPAEERGCASILRSGYAVLGGGGDRLGIPWAALGAGYFAFLAVCFGFLDLRRTRFLPWGLALCVVLLFGGWASADLMSVMARQLHQWCIGCVVAHCLNAGVVIVGAALIAGRMRTRRDSSVVPHALPAAALLAGSLAFIVHVAFTQLFILGGNASELGQRYLKITSDPDYVALCVAREKPVDVDLADGAIFAGPADAPHEIVAFVDFQCPSCRELSRVLDEVISEASGRARVAIRHFPQDSACNPAYSDRGHIAACDAARAAEAVRQLAGHEAFGKYRKILYEHQSQLIGADFAGWAAPLGVDPSRLKDALTSAEVTAQLRKDMEVAGRAGVKRLPAIYLDRRFVEHYRSKEAWLKLLAAEASETE